MINVKGFIRESLSALIIFVERLSKPQLFLFCVGGLQMATEIQPLNKLV